MPFFQKIKSFFKKFGPGWVTGASDDDPSGIGTYSYAGSRFGLDQIWTMFFTFPLMASVQEVCARIGQVTGMGLAGVLRAYYSKTALITCVLLLVLANTINIAANISAMAASTRLMVDLPFPALALLFALITLVLEIFVSYRVYARYLKFLTFSLFFYVIAAFFVQQDWMDILRHFIAPTLVLSKEFLFSIVAIFGTTISPYLFFWQASTEVEQEIDEGRKELEQRKGATKEEIHAMRLDVTIGMAFSNLVAFFIMITSASTLFRHGIVVESASDAAAALAPIAGQFSSLLFAAGIIGTGLLSIPILAGSASYALSESFGWRAGLYQKMREAHGFYGIITLATLAGLGIVFLGIDPIRLLLITAVLNGLVAPILLTLIMKIGNNGGIMGRWKNSRASNVLGWTTVSLMSGAGLLLILFSVFE